MCVVFVALCIDQYIIMICPSLNFASPGAHHVMHACGGGQRLYQHVETQVVGRAMATRQL